MALVDVVVVSYNSRETLLRCVSPLAGRDEARVIVVDNASVDGTLQVLEGRPVMTVALKRNLGFAAACNVGWRRSDSPFVLLLNPDAAIEWDSVQMLIEVLEREPRAGAVGPRVERPNGSLELSQHRFPRRRSTYGQALFLHRLGIEVTDDVRDEAAYRIAGRPDWLTGSCLLLRRSALEQLGGLDERFFLYREDADLCRRLRDHGAAVCYEPAAVAVHDGGGSSRPDLTLPLHAASRIRYARKHHGRVRALAERAGVALRALTHVIVASGGRRARLGHLRALAAAGRR